MAFGESPRVIVYFLFPGWPIEADTDKLGQAGSRVETLFSNLGPCPF